MIPHHAGHVGGALAELLLLGVVGLGAAYVGAAAHVRARQGWPWRRVGCWLAGLVLLQVALGGRLGTAADTDFRAHAVSHLLLGMAGPLLLVAAAPLTLALRVLPVGDARRLSRLLGSRPVRGLTEPTVAAALNVGGLWLVYATPVYALMHSSAAVHLLVHAHLVGSGYLLTAVLVGRDPMPHRRSFGHRALVLVAVMAAHNVLVKGLYAVPPPGVPVAQAETGALVMYYGGDAVGLVLVVWLCALWARDRRTAEARSTARDARVTTSVS